MKKLLFIYCVFMSFQYSVAQESPKIKLGVQAGYDYVDMRVKYPVGFAWLDEVLYYKGTHSFNVNTYFRFRGKGKFSISSELGFIQKGCVESMAGTPSSPEYKYRIYYVTLPLLANYNIHEKFSLGLGIDLSYLIEAKRNEYDVTDDFKSVDISGIIGIDFSILKFMDIALRYGYGFIPSELITFTDNTGNEIGDMKSYNQHLQLSMRYIFFRR